MNDLFTLEQIRERIISAESAVESFYHIESFSDSVIRIVAQIIEFKVLEIHLKHCS